METLTSRPFLTIIATLLVIGLIRLIIELSNEKLKKNKHLPHHPEEEPEEYNPETELGIGAYVEPITHNQNLIVLTHLKNGLMCDEEMAKYYNIKKLSAVISTLKKRGHDIVYVKDGNRKGYVLKK